MMFVKIGERQSLLVVRLPRRLPRLVHLHCKLHPAYRLTGRKRSEPFSAPSAC